MDRLGIDLIEHAAVALTSIPYDAIDLALVRDCEAVVTRWRLRRHVAGALMGNATIAEVDAEIARRGLPMP